MKSNFFLFILFFCSGSLSGQFPEFSENPIWYVKNNQLQRMERYFFTEDTLFCGHRYSVLNEQKWSDIVTLTGYVRNQEDKVFFRVTNSCEDKEYLMYDFSLTVGDTIYCGYNLIYVITQPENYNYIDSTKFWLVSVDTVNILGAHYNRYKIHFDLDPMYGENDTSEMYWIEGIGSIDHPFYVFYRWQSKKTWYDLACMDKNGVLIYKNQDIGINCDSITGLNNQSDQLLTDIKIYPNPAGTSLNVELPYESIIPYWVEITDIKGRVISTYGEFTEMRITLVLPDLETGQYLVVIRHNKGIITTKVLLNGRTSFFDHQWPEQINRSLPKLSVCR